MNHVSRGAVVFTLALSLGSCGSGEPRTPALPAPVDETPASTAPKSTNRGVDGGGPDYRVIDVSEAGSISGTISVTGAIPARPTREVNRDQEVCGDDDRAALDLLVNDGSGLRNAVVLLEGVMEGKPIESPEGGWQIEQSDCDYFPHVQVIPTNTEVRIVNSDPILHNIHSYLGDETEFNIAQPVRDQVNTHVFTEAGFVYTECDVHSWMQAHVVAVDNPYYAVTDEEGRFSIDGVPPGTYTARTWHEFLGERTQEITVTGGEDTEMDQDLRDLLAGKVPPPPITAAPATKSEGSTATPDAVAETPAPELVIVEMQSQGSRFQFVPAEITIKTGTTVQWVNTSSNRHSSTASVEFEKMDGQTILPAGVEGWSSAFLVNAETFQRTFDMPGSYRYFCRNHEHFGMVATITVEP